jgi:ABC-2 type transport system ATP-binding protein
VGRIRRAIGGTRRRRVTTVVLVVALLILAGIGLSLTRSADAPTPTPLTLPGGPTSASDPTPVQLEVDLYLPPDLEPGATAPAVLLAHGFGGSKASVAQEAAVMADAGVVAPLSTAG